MNYYITLGLVLFAYMNFWFIMSCIKKRNDVADVAWGLGFVLIAWTSFYISSISGIKGFLISMLVSIWGLRLAWHIHNRHKGKPEDYRYLTWREEWGKWFYLRSYLQIYVLQGTLLFVIILPIVLMNNSIQSSLGWFDIIGLMVWIFGFYFETVGDAQLAKFVKNPTNKGKLMQSGLWAYTRHPNYFGEVTQWWGLWLITLSSTNMRLSIIGPLTITFLILKVSGIPMLEKKMEKNPEF